MRHRARNEWYCSKAKASHQVTPGPSEVRCPPATVPTCKDHPKADVTMAVFVPKASFADVNGEVSMSVTGDAIVQLSNMTVDALFAQVLQQGKTGVRRWGA